MAVASGARANVDRFNRNRPDRVQGSEGAGDERRARSFPGSGDDDPTKEAPGLLQRVEDSLTRTHKEIQAALSGPSQDITTPTEREVRPGRRNPNDEGASLLGQGLTPRPPEEEDPIIPGDPSNLGARGRRRRGQDAVTASPVLRRGLLGV